MISNLKKLIKYLLGIKSLKQLELFRIVKDDKIHYDILDEYTICNYTDIYYDQYMELMQTVGLIDQDHSIIVNDEFLCLPEGHFLIIHDETKELVGSFMARHNLDGKHVNSGRIDWLGVHPDHHGKNLGYVLTALAVNRLIDIGYKLIFVGTNNDMLPAIKVYLQSGFIPNLSSKDMYERWEIICKKLNIEYAENDWLKVKKENGILKFLS